MSADELRTVKDYDSEIAELRAERDRLARILEDPAERAARATRREQLAGRWVVTIPLGEQHVESIRKLAGGEAWVWDPEYLTADGWVREGESWRLPDIGD